MISARSTGRIGSMWKPPRREYRPAGVGHRSSSGRMSRKIWHRGVIARPRSCPTSTFASSGNLIADRRYAFGRELAARGDLAAAADLFAQATEAAPAFAAAWFALGEVSGEARRPAPARWRRSSEALAARPAGPLWRRPALGAARRRRSGAGDVRAPMCAPCSTSTRRASTARSKCSPIADRSCLRDAVMRAAAGKVRRGARSRLRDRARRGGVPAFRRASHRRRPVAGDDRALPRQGHL